MISWIQRNLQQHFKAIFVVLLGLIIVSFIFTIGAPGIGRADHTMVSRPFFGVNLASQEEMSRLMNDAAMSVSLQVGYMSLENAQLLEYTKQRYATLHLADELHLPKPTSAELAEFLKTLRAFAGENGEFDPKRYATFRDSFKTNPRSGEAEVGRVLADDWRVDRVQKLLGGPGYVLSGDIKSQMTRADSSYTLGVATADFAAFDPGVKPTDAELNKFFEENSFRYEIPPSVRADYAEFPTTNYISQIVLTEAEVKAFYDSNPSRFPKPAAPAVDPKLPAPTADPALDFPAVHAQVEAALRLERAQRAALKAAADFSLALYESKVAQDSPGFNDLLTKNRVAMKRLAPFTRENGPAELGGSAQIGEEAFKLGVPPLSYFTDALATPTGAAVVFWRENLPARKPLFAEVKSRVSSDYLESEKQKRFTALGQTLRGQIETHLKSGEAFDKAVAASNSPVKLEVKTLAPFTLRAPPQDLDYPILSALDRLEKGRVSEMIVTKDKGYLVYVAEKKAPDFTDSNPQFATTRNQMASYLSRVNAGAYIGEIVDQEAKKSEPVAR